MSNPENPNLGASRYAGVKRTYTEYKIVIGTDPCVDLASLQTYLSNKNLIQLPPEVFTLEDISILTLRNNKLKELSPVVARLVPRLRELNVSFGQLDYLPMEIKGLIRHTNLLISIRISVNPFYQPIQRPNLERRHVEGRIALSLDVLLGNSKETSAIVRCCSQHERDGRWRENHTR